MNDKTRRRVVVTDRTSGETVEFFDDEEQKLNYVLDNADSSAPHETLKDLLYRGFLIRTNDNRVIHMQPKHRT